MNKNKLVKEVIDHNRILTEQIKEKNEVISKLRGENEELSVAYTNARKEITVLKNEIQKFKDNNKHLLEQIDITHRRNDNLEKQNKDALKVYNKLTQKNGS